MAVVTEVLKGKVVLVTGAGKGVGRAVARVFARHGALVAANDITPVNLDVTIAEIENEGGLVRDYVCDIAKRLPVRSLVDQVVADWGRVDYLVNCARVDPRAVLVDMDEWDWHRTLDVNLSGAFYTMQAVGRLMRAQRSGVIVNLALDLNPGAELLGRGAYIASKTGLIGLTRAAAQEFAAYQVSIYLISQSDEVAVLGEELEGSIVSLPTDTIADPDQVAQVALHLCSGGAGAHKKVQSDVS
jgi:3-oxoacyl-[acyl-carrier protein] reductase